VSTVSTTAAWLGLCLAPLGASPLAAASRELVLEFERFNQTHVNLVGDAAPIHSGPLTVRLSSPQNELTLEHNGLRLEGLADGRHGTLATVRFSGGGRVRAEIDFGGIPASFESDVEFPSQEVLVGGEVRISRQAEHYELTVIDLPRFVEIELRSTLVDQLVSWCARLSLLVAGDAGCDDLGRLLSRPRLPLPGPGESFLVAASELEPAERERLDAYLAGF
jgi:hypothetical protein